MLRWNVHSTQPSDDSRVIVEKHWLVQRVAASLLKESLMRRIQHVCRHVIFVAVIHRVLRWRMDAASSSGWRCVPHCRSIGEAVVAARVQVADASSSIHICWNLQVASHLVVLLKQRWSQGRCGWSRAPVAQLGIIVPSDLWNLLNRRYRSVCCRASKQLSDRAVLEVSHILGTVIARRNRSNNSLWSQLEQLMTCIVDVGYVFLDSFDHNAHGALTWLLARSDVDIVGSHQLVDCLRVDVNFGIIKDESNRQVSLNTEC